MSFSFIKQYTNYFVTFLLLASIYIYINDNVTRIVSSINLTIAYKWTHYCRLLALQLNPSLQQRWAINIFCLFEFLLKWMSAYIIEVVVNVGRLHYWLHSSHWTFCSSKHICGSSINKSVECVLLLFHRAVEEELSSECSKPYISWYLHQSNGEYLR